MKKLTLSVAAFGLVMLTACGDDSSSSPSSGCNVNVGTNSVDVVASLEGYSTTTTYTLTETGYKVDYHMDGVDPMDVPTAMTLEGLKTMGEQQCEAFNNAETVEK